MIHINDKGEMKLLNNYFTMIEIAVYDKNSLTLQNNNYNDDDENDVVVSQIIYLYANIIPNAMDVDLGNHLESPLYNEIFVGNKFNFDIRIQSHSFESITSFHIKLYYNEKYLKIENDQDCSIMLKKKNRRKLSHINDDDAEMEMLTKQMLSRMQSMNPDLYQSSKSFFTSDEDKIYESNFLYNGWMFDCVTNDIANDDDDDNDGTANQLKEVLIVGNCGYLNSEECGLIDNKVLGSINFIPIKKGITTITSHIIKMTSDHFKIMNETSKAGTIFVNIRPEETFYDYQDENDETHYYYYGENIENDYFNNEYHENAYNRKRLFEVDKEVEIEMNHRKLLFGNNDIEDDDDNEEEVKTFGIVKKERLLPLSTSTSSMCEVNKLLGDFNGDCYFDIEDILFLQKHLHQEMAQYYHQYILLQQQLSKQEQPLDIINNSSNNKTSNETIKTDLLLSSSSYLTKNLSQFDVDLNGFF
jgi:hypothetical protein